MPSSNKATARSYSALAASSALEEEEEEEVDADSDADADADELPDADAEELSDAALLEDEPPQAASPNANTSTQLIATKARLFFTAPAFTEDFQTIKLIVS